MGKMLAISQRYSLTSLPDSKSKRTMLLNGNLLFQPLDGGKMGVIVPKVCPSVHDEILSFINDELLADLVVCCLDFNPKFRITVEQALSHPFMKKYHHI